MRSIMSDDLDEHAVMKAPLIDEQSFLLHKIIN